MKTLLLLLFSALIFSSCHDDCPNCGNPPEMLNFTFSKENSDGDILFDETLNIDSLEIVYDDRERNERLNYSIITDAAAKKVYLQSGDVGYLSHRGIHNFTILYNGKSKGELDVLFMQKSDPERCCTWYAAESVYFKNIPLDIKKDAAIGGNIVNIVFK